MSASDAPDFALERSLLAGILLGDDAFTKVSAEGVTAESFVDPRHRLIFAAASRVASRDIPPSAPLVSTELHRTGELDRAGSAGYLGELLDHLGVDDPTDLARELRREADARSVADRLGAARELVERGADPDSVVGDLVAALPTRSSPVGAPVLVRLADVTPERVEWLWPGRIPLGKISLLDGDPGLGKSTLTVEVAAAVSRGDPLPEGDGAEPAGVVFLTAEDGLGDTLRPRLDAAGAELSSVVALTGVTDEDGAPAFPTIEKNVSAIAEAARSVGARLVVVDPLMAYLGATTNSYRDQDVRRALAPLAQAAEEGGFAVLVVRHLRKSEGAAIYRGGGSIGISGAARSVLLVAKDPEDEDRRVLASVKSNLGPPPGSLAFRLQSTGSGVAKIAWEPGTVTFTADQLLAPRVQDDERSARGEAEALLQAVLEDGPVGAKDVLRQAREAGISEITLRRAKASLGVCARKSGLTGGWLWELPPESPKVIIDPEDDQGAHIPECDRLRPSASTFEDDQGDRLRGEERDEVAL